jgi:hypothetical protein
MAHVQYKQATLSDAKASDIIASANSIVAQAPKAPRLYSSFKHLQRDFIVIATEESTDCRHSASQALQICLHHSRRKTESLAAA